MSAFMSIADDRGVILKLSTELAEWQSDDVLCSQQDKSQVEADTGMKAIKIDNSASGTFAILRME